MPHNGTAMWVVSLNNLSPTKEAWGGVVLSVLPTDPAIGLGTLLGGDQLCMNALNNKDTLHTKHYKVHCV